MTTNFKNGRMPGMFFEFASHAGIKVESVKFDFLSNKQYHTNCL